MNNLNRRKFLKSGLIGAAGMVAISNDIMAAKPSMQENKIIYRTLGKTGLKLPVISMGVMNSDSQALVKASFDRGILYFDTAYSYMGGKNEEMLGVALKDVPRKSFILGTKIQPVGVDRATGKPTSATTAEDFTTKFNTSLTRLGMDYVDILYMHNVSSPDVASYQPLVNAMRQIKKEGKARFIGISTHDLTAIVDVMIKEGTWDVVLVQHNFSLTNIDARNAAIKKVADAGLGVVAMKTLAGGYLDRERTKPVNTSAALKWVLSNPNIHTTIPGMTNLDQLELNVKVMQDINMTDQEKKDVLIAQSESGLFCASCKNCIPGCKLNLPIPDIMRAYMYAYGYTDLKLAHTLLSDLSAGNDPCRNCDSCNAVCKNNFNIREKITDISRLLDVPADFIA
jgi:predicted aldo/keto reductase-like oxidoreductase